MPLLEIRDLQKAYVSPEGARTLVIDVPSFQLAAAEQVALQGSKRVGEDHAAQPDRRDPEGRQGADRDRRTDISSLREAARDDFRARNLSYVFQTFNLLQATPRSTTSSSA